MKVGPTGPTGPTGPANQPQKSSKSDPISSLGQQGVTATGNAQGKRLTKENVSMNPPANTSLKVTNPAFFQGAAGIARSLDKRAKTA